MIREAGIWALEPQNEAEFLQIMSEYAESAQRALSELGVQNASVWRVPGYVFGYRELPDDYPANAALAREAEWPARAGNCVRALEAPGALRLMYHDIGDVKTDKSLIRRRVFATRLKPGCAEEYYNRHKALIDARGGRASGGKETNFTIWCAQSEIIFGYCELVKALDTPPTPEEASATRAWETRQLEIMDWLTDDVDWLTGETHPSMRCVFLQKGY